MNIYKWLISSALIASIFFFVVSDLRFDPLIKSGVHKFFRSKSIRIRKVCSIDMIGMGFSGEYFELYKYELIDTLSQKELVMDLGNNWENNKIEIDCEVSNWKKMPFGKYEYEKFDLDFIIRTAKKDRCFSRFESNLNDYNNYYSSIYFMESHYYFLIYCPNALCVYYVRCRT